LFFIFTIFFSLFFFFFFLFSVLPFSSNPTDGSRPGGAAAWVSSLEELWCGSQPGLGFAPILISAWWLTVGNGFGFADLGLGLPISSSVVVCLLTLILIWLFWMTFDFDFDFG
jgi:hypothetical protein